MDFDIINQLIDLPFFKKVCSVALLTPSSIESEPGFPLEQDIKFRNVLEKILRSGNFRSLDLLSLREGVKNEDIESIADTLQGLKEVTKLKKIFIWPGSDKTISFDGARQIARILDLNVLKSFGVEKTSIGNAGLLVIVEAITKNKSSSLKSLSLEECDIIVDHQGSQVLDNLLKNSNLTKLSIVGNEGSYSGFTDFLEALRYNFKLCKLNATERKMTFVANDEKDSVGEMSPGASKDNQEFYKKVRVELIDSMKKFFNVGDECREDFDHFLMELTIFLERNKKITEFVDNVSGPMSDKSKLFDFIKLVIKINEDLLLEGYQIKENDKDQLKSLLENIAESRVSNTSNAEVALVGEKRKREDLIYKEEFKKEFVELFKSKLSEVKFFQLNSELLNILDSYSSTSPSSTVFVVGVSSGSGIRPKGFQVL